MAIINNGLVGQEMRLQMECKKALETKGSFYVGTGGKDTTYKDIPETTGFDPGTTNNGVLIRDTSETATNTTGWKVAKITADNLEGGRVAQATNAEKADSVSYNGDYKSFTDAFVSACLLKIYPVGSIYMSANNVNPSIFLGGTWEAWGAGRVPVGVDASDADFATVEKTGGEKNTTLSLNNLPEHKHFLGVNKPDAGRRLITTWISNINATTFLDWNYSATPSESSTILTRTYGSTAYESAKTGKAGLSPEAISPVTNLQPYITCYMWKRTA